MKSFSMKGMMKHPSLIPLVVCVGGGVLMAAFYTIRLAVANPDVSWNRKKNPEPWQEYDKKQYKFYSPLIDYSKLEDNRPKF